MTEREQHFAERPLIAGSFYGIRSWRVTPEGILTGVHAREPWGINGNEAICSANMGIGSIHVAIASMSASFAEASWAMSKMMTAMQGKVFMLKKPRLKPKPEPVPHGVATMDCQCGFYAYFDLGHNPHHVAGNVLGIVEGYGTMTIGRRGYRASKARIVALIEPVPESVRKAYATLPPIFSTLDAALAEFPLSTPPDGEVAPPPTALQHPPEAEGVVVTFTGGVVWTLPPSWVTFTPFTQPLSPRPMDARSVRRRALDARRNRNTGPANPNGIDGHYRRRTAR